MKLVAKMEEETCRLARETASGGEGEGGSDQEVRNVLGVNFARDGLVVAGGASVFHDGAVIGGEPEKTEDGCVHLGVGGSEVVHNKLRFGHCLYFRNVKERGGRVADCNDGAGVESGFGDKIVMWRGRILGSTEGAGVDDSALEFTSRAFLFHFVG